MNCETGKSILIEILKSMSSPQNAKKINEAKGMSRVLFRVFRIILSFASLSSAMQKRDDQNAAIRVPNSHGNPRRLSEKLRLSRSQWPDQFLPSH